MSLITPYELSSITNTAPYWVINPVTEITVLMKTEYYLDLNLKDDQENTITPIVTGNPVVPSFINITGL